jgi:hypothetical protein
MGCRSLAVSRKQILIQKQIQREKQIERAARENASTDDPSPPLASAEPPALLVELPPNAKRLLIELYGPPDRPRAPR